MRRTKKRCEKIWMEVRGMALGEEKEKEKSEREEKEGEEEEEEAEEPELEVSPVLSSFLNITFSSLLHSSYTTSISLTTIFIHSSSASPFPFPIPSSITWKKRHCSEEREEKE
jgi:hypothetical protein